MSKVRVAICDRCSHREDVSAIWASGSRLPNGWGRVEFARFFGDTVPEIRNEDWCPSCAEKLHNLFILGFRVVRDEEQGTVSAEGST